MRSRERLGKLVSGIETDGPRFQRMAAKLPPIIRQWKTNEYIGTCRRCWSLGQP